MKITTFPIFHKTLLSKHPDIAKVKNDTIREIEKAYENEAKLQATSLFILSITTTLVFSIYLPSTLDYFYSVAKTWESQFSTTLNIRSLIDNHPGIKLSILAILTLIFLIPRTLLQKIRNSRSTPSWIRKLLNRNKNTPKRKRAKTITTYDEFAKLDTRSFAFALFTILFYYFELLVVISISYSYTEIVPKEITRWVTLIWLMAPMVLISFLPGILFSFLAILLAIAIEERKHKTVDPETIIVNMEKLINQIDEIDSSKHINVKDRTKLVYKIQEISDQIRRTYTNEPTTNRALSWAGSQMNKVADSFESLTTIVLFPAQNDLSVLISLIIPYLNGFLINNYKKLPQEIYENLNLQDVPMKKGWLDNSIFGFILLSIYMIVPIIIVGISISFFSLKVEPLIQTFLNILYGAWILFGIVYFSERLSPNFRKSLFELLGTFFPNR